MEAQVGRGGGLISTPLFSIIMPVYNKGPYIRDTIASVLAQTFSSYEVRSMNHRKPAHAQIEEKRSMNFSRPFPHPGLEKLQKLRK